MGRKPGDSHLGTTRRWWSLWLLAAALAALAILVVACGGGEEKETTPTAAKTAAATPGKTAVSGTPSAKGPLKIGLLLSYTGDLADFGAPEEKAARMAVDEINAAGGVLGQPIQVATGDDATDPSQGVSEATRLVNVEHVDALIGALASGVTLPVAESVTGPNHILQISHASTSPALTTAKDNDYLFRTTISDAAQGVVLAKVATDEGIKSACTMYINNAYGQGLSQIFTDNFEKAGGTVTAQVPHESNQATYASELGQCTAGNPDALVAPAYPQSARVFLREAVEAGKVKKFLFTDGTQSPDMFDAIGWQPFDGMKGTAATNLTVAAGTAFENAYTAKYGPLPAVPYLREIYDAVYLIALAAEKAGSTDSTAMRDAIRDVANPPGDVINPGTDGFKSAVKALQAGTDINYEGASGPVDLDKNGDVVVGAIGVWHVDAANKKLPTDQVYKVDLSTNTLTLAQ